MSASTLTETELNKISTQAIEAKATAYCPYSNFRVGACILTEEGEYITGANVENVSYPVGTCAERCAFAKAITSGHRNFKAVAISTDITPGSSPCGMCRQFMREFCRPSVPIYMYDKDNNYRMQTIGELIPLAFGPDDLATERKG